ncbi:hypothetical protein SKAU_G00051410 [Synaphobranchus kaupii]|uniref:Uncharacterized protein n=1 Tax=Synaphobranchus kaupii TaxID=118154 RepID=A0A9Q1G3J4_SYNKA|nr:hypothetical protein SKAU_G00051410 [Synaphobranchus kaupii]
MTNATAAGARSCSGIPEPWFRRAPPARYSVRPSIRSDPPVPLKITAAVSVVRRPCHAASAHGPTPAFLPFPAPPPAPKPAHLTAQECDASPAGMPAAGKPHCQQPEERPGLAGRAARFAGDDANEGSPVRAGGRAGPHHSHSQPRRSI